MPKYVTFWEIDSSRMSVDPVERAATMSKLIEGVKQMKKNFPEMEWGSFLGENTGYSVSTGTWQDMVKISQMFAPYVKFKVYQALSIEEVEGAFKSALASK
jgi:hypothetical protein